MVSDDGHIYVAFRSFSNVCRKNLNTLIPDLKLCAESITGVHFSKKLILKMLLFKYIGKKRPKSAKMRVLESVIRID